MARGRGSGTRRQRTPSPEWLELRKHFIHPGQEPYEEIRPVVNFGQPIKDRAAEVGVAPKTLSRKVQQFIQHGIPGLMPGTTRRMDDQRQLPQPIRDYIVQLKAEYPPFSLREIASIVHVRFNRTVSHHTVDQTLQRFVLPKVLGRRFPRYYKMRDPAERREAILRLHLEGWSVSAIAGYLGAPRRSVQAFLTRWITDGVRSLPGKKAGRPRGAHKVTLPVIATIKEMQEASAIGEFRMAAYLKQQHHIELSPRTCGRIMAANRDLYGLRITKPAPPRPKKAMPFAATLPHQIWSVDICYIEQHHLPDHEGPFYIITILDNYSRKIVASAPSRSQDLWAFLLVFCTALYVYGAPSALVSDGGGVFRANAALRTYEELGIRKEQIEPRQAWQNYVESSFAVMKRMALYGLEDATSWEEVCAVHGRFVVDYNHQEHFAHQDRADGLRTPSEVMGWVRGRPVETPTLRDLFDLIYGTRIINRVGYIRYANWRIYGDEQLVGQRASVWVLKETHTLTLVHDDAALAEFGVEIAPDGRHFTDMHESRRFPSPSLAPPFPRLWDEQVMAEMEWRKVYRARPYAPWRRNVPQSLIQPALLAGDDLL